MSPPAVAIKVGGQTFRVRSEATEQDLQRFAATVDRRLRACSAGSPNPSQALLLVALSLAHELECENARRKQLQLDSEATLQNLLRKVDHLLELTAPPTGETVTQPDDPRRP